MKRGRYNIQLPVEYGNIIKKFNVYQNDACTLFIFFEGHYIPIQRKEPYKGGWLYQMRGEIK